MAAKIIASIFISLYLLGVCSLLIFKKFEKRVPTRIGVSIALAYLVVATLFDILIYI